MDKLEFYRQCIQQLLTEYSKVAPINGDIEVQKFLILNTTIIKFLIWDGTNIAAYTIV